MDGPHLHVWSLKRWLLELHYDLLLIDLHVQNEWDKSLSEFEKCVLASEDHRFFSHFGVDFISIAREFFRLITLRRVRGASTIEMQFVRTITANYSRTLTRKLREAVLAYVIQFRYSKIQILRSYLRKAFFGSHLIGANCAARKIYGRSAMELRGSEATLIASMLIYPRPHEPTPEWEERVSKRGLYINFLYRRHEEKLNKLPA